MVKISLTLGIFLMIVFLFKIVAARIGRELFLEPEIFILTRQGFFTFY